MVVKSSKCLALIMALCLTGFSGALAQALCPAPGCNAIPSASERVNKLACHGNQSLEVPECIPPCLLKGSQPLDFAASGPAFALSDNHLSGAYHAFTVVEPSAAVRVSASKADAALPILCLNQPIYLISLSLLC
jgi:hypothetical protein